MEVAGRRAAWSVLSELRLALVASGCAPSRPRRRRRRRRDHDGLGAGRRGARGLLRPLPAAGRARLRRPVPGDRVGRVPRPRGGGDHAAHAAARAGVHVADRPYTADRTRERWQALRALSSHFLDVVRGLPTLRAFGRGSRPGGDRRRGQRALPQATMETLRISFLSGSVLELAATIGVALVAVTAGVRLVDGSLGLQAGLTVIVLAPELYLPFRRLGAEYHASADGLAVAERMFELLDAPAAVGAGGPQRAPSPATAHGAPRAGLVLVPVPSGPGARRVRARALARRGRRARRRERRRQEHGGGAAARACCRRPPAGSPSATSTWPTAGSTRGGGSSPGCRSIRRCSAAGRRQHPARRPRSRRWSGREAAALAGADEFIAALPDGYDTLVGDGERLLSPGERRRIGLARAFLRDAPLVILDEPTADLDPRSVAIVADAVRRLRTGRTMLVIAHRPELVQSADRVVRADRRSRGARARRERGMNDANTLRALLRLVQRAALAPGLGSAARRADGGVRRRVDGDVRVSDLARGRAPADPVADGDDRRRPVLRHRPPVRPLPRATRLPRHDAARARPAPRAVLRADRAAGAGGARRLPQGGSALADGRGRRRAPEPLPARSRAAARRAPGRRRVGRRRRRVAARGGARARRRPARRGPGRAGARGVARARRRAAGRRPRADELSAELVESAPGRARARRVRQPRPPRSTASAPPTGRSSSWPAATRSSPAWPTASGWS